MKTIVEFLAVLIGIGSFLPLVRSDAWIVRGWDFPRLQLFTGGVTVLLALLAIGPGPDPQDRAIPGFLAAAVLFQAWSMRRYQRLWKREVKEGGKGPRLKVLVANVLMSNRDSARLLALVKEHRPDLLVALETDLWWVRQLDSLADDYPDAVEIPQDDTYGMVVRSRGPLVDARVERLIRKNIPSVHAMLCLSDGTMVRLHAVHPKPPFPDEDTSSTERDAELLLIGKSVKQAGGPAIVLGDLNDVAWSRTTRLFQKISGLLDPRIGRGCYSTFHADHGWMRWPLDHVFISDHFRVCQLQRLPAIGSDHFPMLAEISYEPNGKSEQDGPDADREEKKDAESKIAGAD